MTSSSSSYSNKFLATAFRIVQNIFQNALEIEVSYNICRI